MMGWTYSIYRLYKKYVEKTEEECFVQAATWKTKKEVIR
jgi:hypothetical protein